MGRETQARKYIIEEGVKLATAKFEQARAERYEGDDGSLERTQNENYYMYCWGVRDAWWSIRGDFDFFETEGAMPLTAEETIAMEKRVIADQKKYKEENAHHLSQYTEFKQRRNA